MTAKEEYEAIVKLEDAQLRKEIYFAIVLLVFVALTFGSAIYAIIG